MTKKDILIFLNIYLIALRGIAKRVEIEEFRDVVYSLCSQFDYSEFWRVITRYKLCSSNSLFKGFTDYMAKIEKILDI